MGVQLVMKPLTVTLSPEVASVIRAVAQANHLSVNDLASLAAMTGLQDVRTLKARWQEWLDDKDDNESLEVYAAEGCLAGRGQRFRRIKDAQRYVDAVCQSLWWRERFARVHGVEARGNGFAPSAYVGEGESRMHLPLHMRNQVTVLHELAHVVQPGDSKPHGPEYLRFYCDMIAEFMGEEAASCLVAALRQRRLRIGQAKRVYGLARPA